MSDIDPVTKILAPDAKHGRLRRLFFWMRDYDSDRAKRYYAEVGVWSSRVYAVLIILAVTLVTQLSRTQHNTVMLGICLGWTFLIGRAYLWYQAKEILAFDFIDEKQATKDLWNSIWPLISVGILIGGWVLLNFFYWMQWATFGMNYSAFGWFIIASSALDVIYDLRINTRVTFILSKVPGRVEFGASQH